MKFWSVFDRCPTSVLVLKVMTRPTKNQIRAYGIRLLLSNHPEIRRLKRKANPCFHGNKHWMSGWLLIDYLKHQGLSHSPRIMELGCGWGLAGIYCAKNQGAVVTAVDVDPDVFPFLHLHAKINGVEISTLKKDFDELKRKHLTNTDILIGADICFWDSMVGTLRRLILRALRSGVYSVIIADPFRSTFEEIAEYFINKSKAEVLEWTTRRPYRITGRILRINA